MQKTTVDDLKSSAASPSEVGSPPAGSAEGAPVPSHRVHAGRAPQARRRRPSRRSRARARIETTPRASIRRQRTALDRRRAARADPSRRAGRPPNAAAPSVAPDPVRVPRPRHRAVRRCSWRCADRLHALPELADRQGLAGSASARAPAPRCGPASTTTSRSLTDPEFVASRRPGARSTGSSSSRPCSAWRCCSRCCSTRAAPGAKAFSRVSIFLPYAVPAVISSLLWGFLYLPAVSPFYCVFDAARLGRPRRSCRRGLRDVRDREHRASGAASAST